MSPSAVVALVEVTSTIRCGALASQVSVKWTDVTGPGDTFLAAIAGLDIIGRCDQYG